MCGSFCLFCSALFTYVFVFVPVNKHETCFLLCLLNISFMSVLNIFIHRSFNTLLKFISILFFDAIINGNICISVNFWCMEKYLSFIYSNTLYKMHAIFYGLDNFPPKWDIQNARKYMTRCSTSYHRSTNQKYNTYHSCLNTFYHKVRNKCDWECVDNGGLNGLMVGMYMGRTPMEYLR